ncbi:2,3-dimethylmalate lyase [Zhongshania aliphaticivorans]|uniref:2,3-dimethylmalate lyase n=1 Tax=Zhongshania aliphaticivorans TaxID=1470434 RepID=A0A5S9MWF9_9GAMM|nr:isocitrate lyase/PEP mutase family protein [Zhongshania aliphaticivorans]CAA0080704.1 2,3-dimethylmalate lyase [Zhongshania aliphaticivorans]CAA0085571.1 2,3-dimethylmalate lyase [Zhongshania aliphaticivorans]
MSHAYQLRQHLAKQHCLRAPGVYDGLSALLAEQAGFQLGFVSGACIAFARHGRPDMGLVSMSEVADVVAVMRERVSMPLAVDIDTGFGNALNVQRTVRVLERAGASALQIEDQVMPKRCGHMAGKQVVNADEMVGKIKAALDARQDANTVIIARTDALGVNGLDDALERAEKYVEAGADVLFIEAPKTPEQMQIISQQFASRIPLVHNLVEGGGSPIDSADGLEQLGYKIALYPAALLHLFVPQAQALLSHISQHGSTGGFEGLIDLSKINDLLGAPELLQQGEKYSV